MLFFMGLVSLIILNLWWESDTAECSWLKQIDLLGNPVYCSLLHLIKTITFLNDSKSSSFHLFLPGLVSPLWNKQDTSNHLAFLPIHWFTHDEQEKEMCICVCVCSWEGSETPKSDCDIINVKLMLLLSANINSAHIPFVFCSLLHLSSSPLCPSFLHTHTHTHYFISFFYQTANSLQKGDLVLPLCYSQQLANNWEGLVWRGNRADWCL